jgi:hypothetical protein
MPEHCPVSCAATEVRHTATVRSIHADHNAQELGPARYACACTYWVDTILCSSMGDG